MVRADYTQEKKGMTQYYVLRLSGEGRATMVQNVRVEVEGCEDMDLADVQKLLERAESETDLVAQARTEPWEVEETALVPETIQAYALESTSENTFDACVAPLTLRIERRCYQERAFPYLPGMEPEEPGPLEELHFYVERS